MARSGVHKSEVQKARDRLVAQGRHPSIDAVREQLGNTGSKTTIQRYLRELEEEDGGGPGKEIAVSEAIRELASRLGARLKEEAEERVIEQRRQYDAKLQEKDIVITQLRQENVNLCAELQRTEAMLRGEAEQHSVADQLLADARLTLERLAQQVASAEERMKDNEAHRQSLEEKHQHTRDALEHYRQSVKEQREQDQRRHEHQVQQLQVELRTLNQTLIVKQNELTQLYQDTARASADLAAHKKDLRRIESEAKDLREGRGQLQQRVGTLEANAVALTERLEQSEIRRSVAEQDLAKQLNQLHTKELELVQLQTRLASHEELLSLMKKAYPTSKGDSIREGEASVSGGDR